MKFFIFLISLCLITKTLTPQPAENNVGNNEIEDKPALAIKNTNVDTIELKTGLYQFKYSIPKNLSMQILKGSNNDVDIYKNNKIRVLYEKDGVVYYEYLIFNKEELRIKYNKGKVFSMDKEAFNQITRPVFRYFKGVDAGAYTIPFRLRGAFGDNFDFESSLSLQANVIFGYGSRYKENSWIDFSFGLGITGVNLSNDNSNVETSRTASALTFSLGALVKPSKNVNFGLFLGWDLLGNKDQEVEWIYNKKTWIGLGINISFDKISNTELKTNSSAQNKPN